MGRVATLSLYMLILMHAVHKCTSSVLIVKIVCPALLLLLLCSRHQILLGIQLRKEM